MILFDTYERKHIDNYTSEYDNIIGGEILCLNQIHIDQVQV